MVMYHSAHPGTYLQWNINYTDWRKLVEDMRLPYQFRADDDWIVSESITRKS
jgi:uncharacterized protein YeeX (DUF496 family)